MPCPKAHVFVEIWPLVDKKFGFQSKYSLTKMITSNKIKQLNFNSTFGENILKTYNYFFEMWFFNVHVSVGQF